ncbi:MAG: rubredoxin-type Fe(Cys)4 protein [Candidatus Aminicenantes bacterium]|nr:rubredoxin-type Fe(Cys)4 protein [Candidatus Aminicenantes bacterium]
MAKYECAVCGLIYDEEKEGKKWEEYPGDLCPACGVPKTAFQPYKDPVSPKRRKVLDLHLHPVTVHFPQAFSVFMLFLIGMGFILQGSLKTDALTAARVLSIFLPLSVAVSIISGLLDGKNRFKRLTTPMLKKKILVGMLFFILSVGVLLVLVFSNLQSGWPAVSAALTALCVLCSLFLGYKGGRLAGTIVPG